MNHSNALRARIGTSILDTRLWVYKTSDIQTESTDMMLLSQLVGRVIFTLLTAVLLTAGTVHTAQAAITTVVVEGTVAVDPSSVDFNVFNLPYSCGGPTTPLCGPNSGNGNLSGQPFTATFVIDDSYGNSTNENGSTGITASALGYGPPRGPVTATLTINGVTIQFNGNKSNSYSDEASVSFNNTTFNVSYTADTTPGVGATSGNYGYLGISDSWISNVPTPAWQDYRVAFSQVISESGTYNRSYFQYQTQSGYKITASSSARLIPTKITVTSNWALQITPATIPNARVGQTYYPDNIFNATGGSGDYVWKIISGTLPPGIFISSAGVLIGPNPVNATPGIYHFTVQATDTNIGSLIGTAAYSLAVLPESSDLPDISMVDPVPQLLGGNRISTNTQLLADSTKGRTVSGLATDGVAQVLIRIPAIIVGDVINVNFQSSQCASLSAVECAQEYGLLFDPTTPPTNLYNSPAAKPVSVTAINSSTGPVALIALRAPLDFVRPDSDTDQDAAQRSVSLTITSTVTNQSQTLNIPVVRPPVILVHGLWANSTNWNTPGFGGGDFRAVGQTLANDAQLKRFIVDAPNYGGDVTISSPVPAEVPTIVPGSSLGFNYGATKTAKATTVTLSTFTKYNNPLGKPIAAAQADFVAHSMGNLVTRSLQLQQNFKSTPNYMQGYIHKLISIAGPHLGSPLASALLMRDRLQDQGINNSCIRTKLAEFGEIYSIETYVDENGIQQSGAVADLAGSGDGTSLSPALTRLQSITPPRTAYIVGTMSDQAIAALSADFPSYPNLSLKRIGASDAVFTYTYNQQKIPRRGTVIDALKNFCGPVLNPFNPSPLTYDFTASAYPTLMHGPSDGIVPLSSQSNGQNQNRPIAANAVHSGGAILLGLGLIDKTGDNPVGNVNTLLDQEAANAVIDLLNTSVSDPIFVGGQ